RLLPPFPPRRSSDLAAAGRHPRRPVLRGGGGLAPVRPPPQQTRGAADPARPTRRGHGVSSPAEDYMAAQEAARHPVTAEFAAAQRFRRSEERRVGKKR